MAKKLSRLKTRLNLLDGNYGVTIGAYHGNNGRFAENLFVHASKEFPSQRLTFCAVNHHSQNPMQKNVFMTPLTKDAPIYFMQKNAGPRPLVSIFGLMPFTLHWLLTT